MRVRQSEWNQHRLLIPFWFDDMRLPHLTSHTARIVDSGTPLIGCGLAVLIAAAWISALPVVTGMAVLVLGATNATLSRFRDAPTAGPVLYLHTVTYVGLYALFIGAMLHAAASHPTSGLALVTSLDIAASSVPMAIALKRIAVSLRRQFDSPL
jgi:hypothetical protein